MASNESPDFATCQPVLEVADLAEAVHYYTEVLGFGLDFQAGEPPVYACVSRGGLSAGAPASIRFTNWYRDKDQPAGGGWLSFYVDSGLDELHAELTGRGAEVSWEIGDRPWGMREFEIRDLNGHYLRFGSEAG